MTQGGEVGAANASSSSHSTPLGGTSVVAEGEISFLDPKPRWLGVHDGRMSMAPEGGTMLLSTVKDKGELSARKITSGARRPWAEAGLAASPNEC